MAAQRAAGRPVKLALTRQQMFSFVGYRTPTIQRIRLGADKDGTLTAIVHDVVEQTAAVKEFAEQTAAPSRKMYASPNRRTSHRLAALDVPVRSGCGPRANARACSPPRWRWTNSPWPAGSTRSSCASATNPSRPGDRKAWSDRHLVECLRTGAERFGWAARDPSRAAAATASGSPAPAWRRRPTPDGHAGQRRPIELRADRPLRGADRRSRHRHRHVDRADPDRGGRAGCRAGGSRPADRRHRPAARLRRRRILRHHSWGSAIVAAAQQFRHDHGDDPLGRRDHDREAPENADAEKFAVHSFGAHFVEVHVNRRHRRDPGPRMLGVFSVGRVDQPATLRSQLIGGMTMGLSMALHEESVRDPRFGHVVTQDLASYHISCARRRSRHRRDLARRGRRVPQPDGVARGR